MTARILRQRYEADLKALQDKCKHEKSEWMEYSHAPGHFAGEVKVCETCEKILETKLLSERAEWTPEQILDREA